MVMVMVRSTFRSAFSLCLFALAGYGAYVPLELVWSAEAAQVSQPPAINAVSADVSSRPAEMSPSAEANPLQDLKSERTIVHDMEFGDQSGATI